MSHWNYRVVRHTVIVDGEEVIWYALHEAYYDDAGEVTGTTDDPVTFGGDDVAELKRALTTALNDCDRFPPLDALEKREDD